MLAASGQKKGELPIENYKENELAAINRIYKARMFEMIFSDKKELLELYNAINGTHYDDPELLEIQTPGFMIFYNGRMSSRTGRN